MLHHLATATIHVAKLVNYNCHPLEDGNKRMAIKRMATGFENEDYCSHDHIFNFKIERMCAHQSEYGIAGAATRLISNLLHNNPIINSLHAG